MTEFKTVMREYTRMCEGNMRCENCPIASNNNGIGIACHLFVRKFPEEAERIIMQWAEEYPVMTNRKKFKEVFGKDLFKLLSVEESWSDTLKWLDEEYKETK